MSRKYQITACVTINHHHQGILENIESFVNQVDAIHIYDSADQTDDAIISQLQALPKTTYYHNDEHPGIGKNLNQGAQEALNRQHDFLLIMAQNSCATPGMLRKLLLEVDDSNQNEIGILSPFHMTSNSPPPKNKTTKKLMTVMSLGSLLNLQAYLKVGPFKEDYFMDYIDHEYCLRLKSGGFQVLQVNKAVVRQKISQAESQDPHAYHLPNTHSSILKHYYTTRNRLYVSQEYRKTFKQFCNNDMKKFFLSTLRILFFEQDKYKKLSMIVKGIRDYKQGKSGKYP